ncbi:MAG: hemolysin family protein [Christensenellales bacterium]|jgi:putative hemolysin
MDDPSGSSIFSSVLLIIILTVINAILAGAEMAFVSLNPAKIKQLADEGNKKAKRVQKLLADSDSFLSAIQVGITIGGFFNSASASQAFVRHLAPHFGATAAAETIATLIVTLIISYITLVLGELYPKQIALQVPEQFAMAMSGFIAGLKAVFMPFIKLLNASTGLLKKITPIDFTKKEEKLTRSEMKALLNSSRNDGAIDIEEFNMMRGVLSLDSRFVTEIMVPRVDAEMIDMQDSFVENLARLMTYKHSRVPLFDDDKDNILGIVHLVDVLINWEDLNRGKLTLKEIARPALFVPETLMTDELLVKFRTAKTHMAIIVDEFGGVEGLVTLDDLLSEIVGDIVDEHSDMSDVSIRKISESEYFMKGTTPLADLNRMFDMQIHSDEADTIAGYIITELGYIPKPRGKERLSFKQYSFIVMSATPTRILGVKMTVHE